MPRRSKHLSPREAARKLRTRDQVRKYLIAELPGWDHWLTAAAASVQAVGWDRQMLRPLDDLLDDLTAFAKEWVEVVGQKEAEDRFLPYAQLRSYLSSDRDYPAAVALTPLNAPSYDELARWLTEHRALPSPVFIGLIGAVGIVAARGPGRRRDLRLEAAVDWVAEALLPFVKSSGYLGERVGTPVVPDRYADPSFPAEKARLKPVPMALAALLAKYVSLPNRKDVELDGERRGTSVAPERVDFGGQVLDQAYELLKRRTLAAATPRGDEVVINPVVVDHGILDDQGRHSGRDDPRPPGQSTADGGRRRRPARGKR